MFISDDIETWQDNAEGLGVISNYKLNGGGES